MKKYIFIIIISLFTFSCQDVIDVDLEEGDTRLVIDAYFNIFNDDFNGSSVTQGGIQLSLTAAFFDDEIQTVSNATVYITNLTDNSILNFVETSTSGFFIPDTSENFQPELNTTYELTVIYENETYIATTQRIPTVPIDNLEEGDGVLFEGTEKEIIITYTDEGSRDDFYLFEFGPKLFRQSRDIFYQGQTFNTSYFYSEEEIEDIGEEITIQISGVDETYYNYFNLVLDQSEASGDPFQSPPALIRGNIINTTNSDNYPLGYFRISESYTASITLED